jgi:FKBP-type peptidyl-prolyl cis-trans isomerase 2
MATRSPSLLLVIFLAVIALIVAGVGAGLLYEKNHPTSSGSLRRVAVGDNVTVNYIGKFGSGPEVGRVFDTSLQWVAENNSSYPKSLEYSARGKGGYTPLAVHVGPNTPGSGYTVGNLTYGGVVTGFWEGLLNLTVHQTAQVQIPPDLGYGPLVASCLVNASLKFTLPAQVVVTPAQFKTAYPGEAANVGARFADPTYGWPDVVLSVNASDIVVQNLPTVGWTSSPNGWPVMVTNVTAATIGLVNELTPADVGLFAGKLASGSVCSSSTYLVSAVDLINGTFTENFNREVVGQTLVFDVTIVAFAPQ